MRILVCGGRDFADRQKMNEALNAIVPRTLPKDVTIIHGAARGADRLAGEWAVVNWCAEERYPADWITHGMAAGPIRNQRMLDEGKPDLVVAFPGGHGTADMVRRAKAAGVPVREIS